MFLNLPLSGYIFCSFVLLTDIFYIYQSLILQKLYIALQKDLEFKIKNPNFIFKEKINKSIYDTFVMQRDKGLNAINTQVIISEKIPVKIKMLESLLRYILSMVIVVGLLGTFVGLTGAIGNIKNVVDALEGSGVSIDKFLGEMTSPLGSMSTAFYTSISGIFSSILLKVLSIYTFEGHKEHYFDSIESYLDNYVMAEDSRDYGKQIFEQSKNMSVMVRNMCDNLQGAFEKSLDNFSKNVSITTTTLNNSGRELDNTINLLSATMKDFNRPLDVFNKNLVSFQSYYNRFGGQINNLHNEISEFSHSIEKHSKVIRENKDDIKLVGENLRQSNNNTVKHYDDLKKIIDEAYKNIKKINSISAPELKLPKENLFSKFQK